MNIKRLKKERAMFLNMYGFLNQHRFSADILETGFEIDGIKEIFIKGNHITNDSFNFIIKISLSEFNQNGSPQVILKLQLDNNSWVITKPQSNIQLKNILNSFTTQLEYINDE